MSHLVLRLAEVDAKLRHGVVYRLERLDNVAEDYGLPLELLAVAKALGVDELHLLEDSRLARLASSCIDGQCPFLLGRMAATQDVVCA